MKFLYFLSLLSFAAAGPLAPVPGHSFFRGPSSLALRDVAADTSDDCRIWVESSPWATCRSFIDLYKISLADFFKMNPVVGSDCYDFRPRTQYCLRMVSRFPVSVDGTCGREMNVTCVGSKFGDCCGASGKCGKTDEFCAIGNCQGGDCPGLGYTTDGCCGKDHRGLMCGGKFGKCCSKDGRCGSTEKECGKDNCQSGDCEGSSVTSVSPSPTNPSMPTISPYSPSPDGTCGYRNKYTCLGTKYYFGYCCGPAGYCGTSDAECSDIYGCQPEYGLCDETVWETVGPSLPSSPSSTSKGVSTVRSTTTITKTHCPCTDEGPKYTTY